LFDGSIIVIIALDLYSKHDAGVYLVLLFRMTKNFEIRQL